MIFKCNISALIIQFTLRQLVLKINYYNMSNGLIKEGQDFVYNFQKLMIMKESQKKFGKIYLGGGRNLLICSSFWKI